MSGLGGLVEWNAAGSNTRRSAGAFFKGAGGMAAPSNAPFTVSTPHAGQGLLTLPLRPDVNAPAAG